MPRKQSFVWKSFELVSKDLVKCNVCKETLTYKGGSTGTMLNHLKGVHSISENRGNEKGQSKLLFRPIPKECDPAKTNEITHQLALMVAKDGLPLSFVDGKGFSNFMASVLPGYKVPCRKTITATLNGIFIEKRNIVQKELDACPVVALTTDCWTSRACEGYMTVTAHGFTEKWDLVDRVLDV